jgi:hypothetical protein
MSLNEIISLNRIFPLCPKEGGTMLRTKRRSIDFLILVLIVILFCSGVFVSVDLFGAEEMALAQSPDQDVYLELAVDPAQSQAGSLITLNVTYHNIGLPYTTILINQPGQVEFDPPLSMPCKYHEHPNGCQEITFRTLAPGEVHFHAWATGEIWSDHCQCWFFSSVSDNGPAMAKITEPLRFFLMFVMK